MNIIERFKMILLVFTMTLIPVLSGARENDSIPNEIPIILEEAEISYMIDRLEEIRKMDKSEFTREEKKELRKEVKYIRKCLNKTSRKFIFL